MLKPKIDDEESKPDFRHGLSFGSPCKKKRENKKKQYESSDSEMVKELLREMEAVVAEPQDPVKRRMKQIKKNRKEQKETELSECEKDKKKKI